MLAKFVVAGSGTTIWLTDQVLTGINMVYDLKINGDRVVDTIGLFRAAAKKFVSRHNTSNSGSFTILRESQTRAGTLDWLGAVQTALDADGDLYLIVYETDGSSTQFKVANAQVKVSLERYSGYSSEFSVTFEGGLITNVGTPPYQGFGTAQITSPNTSTVVPVAGLLPSANGGVVRANLEESTGGFTTFTVTAGTGSFTIAVPTAPSAGTVYNFTWDVVALGSA
jgi:hypothetical protein